MARHRIPGFCSVSVKEARELSKLPHVVDEALSKGVQEARILPDGRVLLYIEGEQGVVYPSREALANLMREAEAEAAGGPFDPAKELLPPRDEFIRDVDEHAKGLGKVLRVSSDVLDRSVESLDPISERVLRLRRAKRMTREVFTPLVAYVGEVMRLVCDGRWTEMPPATQRRAMPVYDPEEWARWEAALRRTQQIAEQAAADVKARGGSRMAALQASRASVMEHGLDAASMPKPIRYDEIDEPVPGREHEPIIVAHDGALVQPVPAVVKALVEPTTYGTLRAAVEGRLAAYLVAKRKGAARDGGA
jgi:hypothetical protein